MVSNKIMKRIFFGFFLSIFAVFLYGQEDSIYVLAKIHSDLKTIEVQQNIDLKISSSTDKIQLLNWISAYQRRGTKLADRKLEDQNKDLHFAKKENLGRLLQLKVKIQGRVFQIQKGLNEEIINISLPKNIENEILKIDLSYTLQLPSAQFTGFGKSKDEALLKYFFLVPNQFPTEKQFQNIGETSNANTYWNVDLEVPANYYSKSNLTKKNPHSFEGRLNENPVFLISKHQYPSIQTSVRNQPVQVDFGYPVSKNQLADLEFFIPLQLWFIQERIGFLPSKILITKPFRNKEDFFGNDDIRFWKFRFPMFSEKENTDLDYFSLLSKKVIQQSVISHQEEHHAIINGIKTYLEIEYLKKYYAHKRLLGDLPDISILGMQPLRWFHASELKLTDRYNLGYRYVMTRNLDQKINEDFPKLSNLNNLTISHFESGRLLHYISEEMGKEQFHLMLKNELQAHQNRVLNRERWVNTIHQASNGKFDFIQKMLNEKHRVNFNLKKAKIQGENINIEIKHNLPKNVPFPLETIDEMGRKETHWLSTKSEKGKDTYTLPNKKTRKIVVNNAMYLPEKKDRDNYRYTQGFFSNFKKIKFSLFKDIENPEYHEVYLNPRLNFNAYDKVLLGINFSNRSFLDKKFNYSLTPYFSTGTGKITGSGAMVYRVMPTEGWFQKMSFGIGGSYYHYDYNNAYRKMSVFSNFLLKKQPRSPISRQFSFSFNRFDKDLPPEINRDFNYEKYNLFNFNYTYANPRLIHEKYLRVNFQTMEDFQKISATASYRYEFARNKKLNIRWFGGYFFNYKAKNNTFDFGISRVSNYAFNYGLLGQSATSGLFSQQFILADAGFKSYIGTTANQWISSVNVDTAVWKMFHLYGDVGVYKNKGMSSKFIWDSGIKARIIPDFLEVYFPIYSTLGFEPQFKDYAQRIRFTLVLNIGAITGVLRRGWY